MTRDQKVVFFPFQGEEVGGSHVSAIGLIEGLDPSRWRPLVGLHNSDGPLASHLTSRGVSFVPAPRVRLPGRARIAASTGGKLSLAAHFIGSINPLARFLREHSVDIVHTNDGEMHVAWSVPALFAGASHVWHHRGDPKARGANLLAPVFADHIVSVSRFSQPSSPILPIKHKLSVIRSPFRHPEDAPDRAEARKAALASQGLPPTTQILGYFGTLIERKRPLVFVDVINAFVRRYPEVPVVGLLFGLPGLENPSADRAVQDHARELGIQDRVRLMGFQTQIDQWMAATDVLVAPAVREPFGRTLIEAMLVGTPVVATASGGNPEAITDNVNGFLVSQDDPIAFVDPIQRLLTDDALRDRIAVAAQRSAIAAYSAEHHVRQISDLYESLLRPPQNSKPGVAAVVSRIIPSRRS